MQSLVPYPAYRDSGVPWLEEVPEHWGLSRMKTLLRERSEKGFPGEPLLAATQSKGVVRKERYENRTVLALKDLHLLKLVRTGDFVISLRSFQGGIEYAREQGIISPAYTILCAVNASTHGYLAWLFKSKPFVDGLSLFVTGIREGQNIDYERLSRSYLPLPPADEQTAIVRFLDHADRQIRRYIRAKQKLIKLLEEHKQAIIHRAVTRGLDPDVRLKPSRVEWLGEVPEHWEVLPVKRLVSLVTSGSRGWAQYYSDEGAVFIQSGNLGRSLSLKMDNVQYVRLPADAEGVRTQVERNDVLVCITGALTGNSIIVDIDLPLAYVNQHVALVRPRAGTVTPRFLAYCLHSRVGQSQFKHTEYGGTKQGLSLDDVKRIVVPLPPEAEQQQIIRALDQQLADANTTTDRINCEIALLHEYRTRLIADVVTGKLDVRAAAASLPIDNLADAEALEPEEELLEDEDGVGDEVSGELVEVEV